MKFVHLSDLHLGKRVYEFSMLEEQTYILNSILTIIDSEHPDAVLIAGDIYDKPIPSSEAVLLLDSFLNSLSKLTKHIFILSGNHDSPERLSFASNLLNSCGVHISKAYNGDIQSFILNDEFGKVHIFMLPFIKPALIRHILNDEKIYTFNDAVQYAIRNMNINSNERNILIAHQFITGAERSESEEIYVGGTENIDASVIAHFDYVALGHLHCPQSIEKPSIRYCGSPLKYSFSEVKHKKSLTIVELKQKNDIDIRTVTLTPQHDMREIRGSYMELTARHTYQNTPTDDYLHIILTDEEDIPNAIGKLGAIYPNIMKIDYDNTRTRSNREIAIPSERINSPIDLFSALFEQQNNHEMSPKQRTFSEQIIQKVWENKE